MELSEPPLPLEACPHGPPLIPAPARPDLSCELVTDPSEAERLRPAWTDLLGRAARRDLTVSPDWMLVWWGVYGATRGRRLRLALFRDAGRLVGLAPLLRRTHWHRGLLPFRRLEFLASGEREGHGVCSNHLDVIAERGAEEAVARSLAAAVAAGTLGAWDELVLPMMDGDGPMPALLTTAFRDLGLAAETVETARAPYIPLPATWDDYLKGLSCTHRRQVTRSLRAFDQWAGGAACLERATDLAGLEKGKRILRELHHAALGRGRTVGRLPVAAFSGVSRFNNGSSAGAGRVGTDVAHGSGRAGGGAVRDDVGRQGDRLPDGTADGRTGRRASGRRDFGPRHPLRHRVGTARVRSAGR